MPGDPACPVRHAVDLFVAVVDRCFNFSTCVGTAEYVGEVETWCARFAKNIPISHRRLALIGENIINRKRGLADPPLVMHPCLSTFDRRK